MKLVNLLLFVLIIFCNCSSPISDIENDQLFGTWFTNLNYFSKPASNETLIMQKNIFTIKETGYVAIMNGVDTMQSTGTWTQHIDTLYIVYTGAKDTFHVYCHLYSNGNRAEDMLGLFGYLYNRVY
jgi:hypothetical protein